MFGDPLILSRLQLPRHRIPHHLSGLSRSGWRAISPCSKVCILARGDARHLQGIQVLLRIFAVAFGMGVVSGIVMPFQFENQLGTPLRPSSERRRSIAGFYEGLTAFFLEATFLGVLLFGGAVPQWAHFGAAVLVAVGTLFSSFWILAFNSWLQTPAGFVMEGAASCRRVSAPSSSILRFPPAGAYGERVLQHHGLCVGCVGVLPGARASSGNRPVDGAYDGVFPRGDDAAANPARRRARFEYLQHQPAKIAAMEGLWETSAPASSVLFAIPDQDAQANRFEVAVPQLASLYLTPFQDGQVIGPAFAREDQPPVLPIFFAFRVMVGIGMLMLLVAWWGHGWPGAANWNIRHAFA